MTLAGPRFRAAVKTFRYLAPAGTLAPAKTKHPLPPPLIPLPPVRQHSSAACGLACLQSAFAYYGKESRRAAQLVHAASEATLGNERYTYAAGTPENTMVRLARSAGLKVKSSRHMRLADLVANIAGGRPVAVGIQAWVTDPKKVSWRTMQDAGHYVVAIGLGDARGNPITTMGGLIDRQDAYLWFMDPAADLGNRGYIPVKEFMTRWHWPADKGEAIHRFGMVFSSTTRPRQTSFVDGVERIK
jgi:hypothetical protein